jgi:hypothetical protein
MNYETAEWMRHICNLLVPIIEEGFRNIYANCVSRSQADVESEDDLTTVQESVITFFQQTLRDIPKWTDAIVDTEYQRIMDSDSDCKDMLDDLIKAAFLSYLKMLNRQGSLITPPTAKRFVHKVYIEAARSFYKSPHLFYSLPHQEYRYHKNSAQIERVLCSSVEETVRKMIPLSLVLAANVTANATLEPNTSESEDITRRISPRSRHGLKNVLKNVVNAPVEAITQPEIPATLTIEKVPVNEIEVSADDLPNSDDDLEFEVLLNNKSKTKPASKQPKKPTPSPQYSDDDDDELINREPTRQLSPDYRARDDQRDRRDERDQRGRRDERERRNERDQRDQRERRTERDQRETRDDREQRGRRDQRDERGGRDQRDAREALPTRQRPKSVEFRIERDSSSDSDDPLPKKPVKQVTYGGTKRV